MTLVSTVVGAGIAMATAALVERVRGRRERADRSIEVKRGLYGEYLAGLSRARNVVGVLVRSVDLDDSGRRQAARDAFEPCIGLRYQVAITAPNAVVDASEAAFRALRDLRDAAANGERVDGEGYLNGRGTYNDRLIALRDAMREDLRATG